MTIIKTVKTEDEMLALGERVANLLKKTGFIALYGDLGAGKTVFARGVASAFGVTHVASPTFTIVCEYPSEPRLYHFDAYRLSDADELYTIGFSDYMNDDAMFVMEWADLVLPALPKDRLDVVVTGSGMEARTVEITPRGAWYEEVFHEDSCL